MERIGVFSQTRPGIRTREYGANAERQGDRPWTSVEAGLSASFLTDMSAPPALLPPLRTLVHPCTRVPSPGPGGPSPRPTSLRAHFLVRETPGARPVPASIELPMALLDPATRRLLGHSVLETPGGVHLFLTLPDRSNGMLTPTDRSLRSFTTLPLELASDRLVRFRAREVLREVAQAHRVAHFELEELRSSVVRGNEDWIQEALFTPVQVPEAALFSSPVDGEIWRTLQGSFPPATRLAFTDEVPGLVRRWWQVGDSQLVRTTPHGFRADLVEGMVRGLAARFQRTEGALVAFEGTEDLLKLLPLSDLERLIQGVREAAEAHHGHAWISWDPSWMPPEAGRVLGRGFSPIAPANRVAWTLDGVGEDSRLVPAVMALPRPSSRSTATPSGRSSQVPTLGDWLRSSSLPSVAEPLLA